MYLGVKWGMVKRGLQAENWAMHEGHEARYYRDWKGEKCKGYVVTNIVGEEYLNQIMQGPWGNVNKFTLYLKEM